MFEKLLPAALLLSGLASQTYLVDAANGPGTHFTSISAAVAAVPDGATLVVRAGSYGGFFIHAKGLTILGEPGVLVSEALTTHIRISNLAAGQRVHLHRLELATPRHGVGCTMQDCAGAVTIDGLLDHGVATGVDPNTASTFRIDACERVLLRGCRAGVCAATDSNTVIEDCTVRGLATVSFQPVITPGLSLIRGRTQVVSSAIAGGVPGFGLPLPAQPNQPAIRAIDADLRLLDGSVLRAGGDPRLAAAAAVDGTGTVRIDPDVVLVTSVTPAIAATLSSEVKDMPAVVGQSAPAGGQLAGAVLGPLHELHILVVGLPGPVLDFPGPADPIWWNPAARTPVAIGTPTATMPLQASVTVPAGPDFVGLVLVWQSVTAIAGELAISNPTETIVFAG